MPLWYVVRDGECWAWTYAKSQKVRNLERESRCTLQVEAGETYTELRGVMISARARSTASPESSRAVGHRARPRATAAADAHVDARQAAKRVALQFIVAAVASWDHRKLG